MDPATPGQTRPSGETSSPVSGSGNTLVEDNNTAQQSARRREPSIVAFPSYTEDGRPLDAAPPAPEITDPTSDHGKRRTNTTSSRLRSASQKLMEFNPPLGMWGATGEVASKAPTLSEIRRGNFSHEGWVGEPQRQERKERRSSASTASGKTGDRTRLSFSRRGSATPGSSRQNSWSVGKKETESAELRVPHEPIARVSEEKDNGPIVEEPSPAMDTNELTAEEPKTSGKRHKKEKPVKVYANGYVPPPKHTWTEATVIGLKAFWKFFITPFGFVITIYGLNIVAWGAMIFFLLIGAAPAMCHPNCNDINSARRKWIEWDSQILTALFCVTGFGLIPWRFRDLYYLLQYRIQGKQSGLRRLAGINREWFRLPGSDNPSGRLPPRSSLDPESPAPDLPDAPNLPIPTSKAPDLPPTGEYAPPTPIWKLDFYIWMYIWNTILQAVLSGLMWGMNRYNRPSWSTGLFVSLGCIVAGAGGILTFVEGSRMKKIEGVQPNAEQLKLMDEEKGARSQGDDARSSNEKPPAEIQTT